MIRLNMFRVIALATLVLVTGQAQAAEWRVVKIIGDAWVDTGSNARKIALTRGLQLSGAAKVTTGRTGKVVLVRGRESMIIGPRAKVEIPASRAGRTTIRQKSGIVRYDVQKRNVRHFEVRTPNIVAVVKGTKFTITQNRFSAEVSVSQGAVQVSHPSSGSRKLVKPGEKAIVQGKRGKMRVVGSNRKATKQAAAGKSGSGNSGNGNSGNGNSGSGNSGSGGSGGGGSGGDDDGGSGGGGGSSGDDDDGDDDDGDDDEQ